TPSRFASEASHASTSPNSWIRLSRSPVRSALASSPTSSVSQRNVASRPRAPSRSTYVARIVSWKSWMSMEPTSLMRGGSAPNSGDRSGPRRALLRALARIHPLVREDEELIKRERFLRVEHRDARGERQVEHPSLSRVDVVDGDLQTGERDHRGLVRVGREEHAELVAA